ISFITYFYFKESDALQQSSTSIEYTESTTISSNPKKQLTKEERKRRDQLLARFSYDLDEIVENEYGEAEIQYKDRSEIKETNNGRFYFYVLIILNYLRQLIFTLFT